MKELIQELRDLKNEVRGLDFDSEEFKGRLYRLSTADGVDPQIRVALQYLLVDLKNLQFASKAPHLGGAVAYAGISAMLNELIRHAEIPDHAVHIEHEPVIP